MPHGIQNGVFTTEFNNEVPIKFGSTGHYVKCIRGRVLVASLSDESPKKESGEECLFSVQWFYHASNGFVTQKTELITVFVSSDEVGTALWGGGVSPEGASSIILSRDSDDMIT